MTGQPASVRGHTPAASRKIAPARRLRTIKDAAKYLDITPLTVRRWIAQCKLRAYRVGGTMIRIDQADLDALVREIPTAAAAAEIWAAEHGQAEARAPPVRGYNS
jgi:excisionase family DNA binding protein